MKIKTHAETRRDRRVRLDEEARLLRAAAQVNTPQHGGVGAAMHDRIVCAIDTACRLGEILKMRNRHVDWEMCQIAIPGRARQERESAAHSVPTERSARGRAGTAPVSGARRRRVRWAEWS